LDGGSEEFPTGDAPPLGDAPPIDAQTGAPSTTANSTAEENRNRFAELRAARQKVEVQEESISWQNRQDLPMWMLFFLLTLLAFVYYHLTIIPKNLRHFVYVAIYVGLILCGVAFTALMTASVFSKNVIELDGKSVTYKMMMFGITVYEHRITKTEIYQIVNTISHDGRNDLLILTPKGYQLTLRFHSAEEDIKDVLQLYEEALLNQRLFIMRINVTSLSVGERFWIEQKLKQYNQEQ